LRTENIGQRVTLMGWVAKRRDFGELTFVDLRDRAGITQVVFNSEDAPAAHAKAKELRGEYVIAVIGEVVARDANTRNPKIATGDVEVRAKELLILNDARTPPFQLDATGDALASEDLRLKYRYLDLRRPQLQANLNLRHRVTNEIRRYMTEQGFTEIETPILIKSTPEGARDYIVPSRVQPGKFFALPQSPQLFKQLCMIAGLDKYFQIARCFRDEDLRADRQPEFTQLDVEMSFATLDQIYSVTEGLFARVFKLIGVDKPPSWLFDVGWIYPALVLMGIWGIGAGIVINLAGLRGIPTELYEAARIDGAGWWAQLRNVTIPMMSPIIFYTLILGVVDVLQYFLVPLVLKNGTGEPAGSTLFYNLNLYRTFFTYQQMSYGATLAWFLFAITLLVTLVLFALARGRVFYAGER